MKIKLIVFVALCLIMPIFAVNPTWTTPSKVAVAAFAVDSYSHVYYPRSLGDLKRSKIHKRVFIETLFSRVRAKYPGKRAFTTYNRSDLNATKEDYGEALLYRSEFVFFSGHGNQQKICLRDYPINVSGGCGRDVCPLDEGGKFYGGETRWVIFDACLTLNINKEGRLHRTLSDDDVDISKYYKIKDVFAGVHAILGFYSNAWEDQQHMVTGTGIASGGLWVYSEDLYDYFTKYFIEDGETIWASFSMASADVVDEFRPFNGKGLAPAIAFIRGYDNQGRYHDTSMERFDHTFNQPISIDENMQFFLMYVEHGDPDYYPTYTIGN